MKKSKTAVIIGGLVLAAGFVIAAIFYFGNHYLAEASTTIYQCKKTGASHLVIVKNEAANPKITDGKLCDTLTIKDEDNKVILIAFGPHEHHTPYDGVTEKQLSEGQSLTVTMNQVGSFHFHDHIGDIVQGDFTVTK